jgi:hypothetical protein
VIKGRKRSHLEIGTKTPSLGIRLQKNETEILHNDHFFERSSQW